MSTHFDRACIVSFSLIAIAGFGSDHLATAHAGFSYLTAPAPGGFMQAGAAPTGTGANPWPGGDFTVQFPNPASDFSEIDFDGPGPATVFAAYADANVVNGCVGTAALGYATYGAHNDAPNNSGFAHAIANGGWSEIFTVSHPTLDGQSGFMQFTLNVSGTLSATGFAGSAGLLLTGYKDNAQLLANPLFDPGGSDPIGSDRQWGNWALSTFAVGEVANKAVDDTVTFAVPFTFGTPFKLGIYARASAGMRSNSGVPGNSTATASFDGPGQGLFWGGIIGIWHGGATIDGAIVASGSGVDWSGPVGGSIVGDLNGDGVVDGADLGLMLSSWGACADCADCPGDLNGDCLIDGADLGLLLSNW